MNRMVLVDTSVWVLHLRKGSLNLEKLLTSEDVICHPFIIGELACGNIRNRNEILRLLQTIPMAIQAEQEEAMEFIESYQLMGKGLGYIDVHLIASAILTGALIWTLDRKLDEISSKLDIGFNHSTSS